MKRFSVNIAFISYCAQHDMLSHLSWFIKLKYTYGNSSWHRFTSYYSIGKRIRNYRRAKNHIEFFLQNKWATINNKNQLLFVKFSSLYELYQDDKVWKRQEPIKANLSDPKDIKLALQRALFQNTLRRQAYLLDTVSDLITPANLDMLKKARKKAVKCKSLAHKIDCKGVDYNYLICTNEGLAQHFGTSRSTVTRIKKLFRMRGWYDFLRNTTRLLDGIPKHAWHAIKDTMPEASYWFKGSVYQTHPSVVLTLCFKNPLYKYNPIPI